MKGPDVQDVAYHTELGTVPTAAQLTLGKLGAPGHELAHSLHCFMTQETGNFI